MRVISGILGKEKVHFIAPASKDVHAEMQTFLKWFHKDSLKIDGLIRAAVAHLWCVTIHPFDDGNGRIARAISDLALAQDENQSMRLYSVSEQLMKDRKHYYQHLQNAQMGDLDITSWIVWFFQVLKKSMKKTQEIFEKTSLMQSFWKKAIHLDLNLRQKKVLQKMLEFEPKGFEGGMTNKKYTHIAKVSRETAKRDLMDLCEKKLLAQKGRGRSIYYILRY